MYRTLFEQKFLSVFNLRFSVIIGITWPVNKVRELIAVKVLHTQLLNTTVVTFKVLP